MMAKRTKTCWQCGTKDIGDLCPVCADLYGNDKGDRE